MTPSREMDALLIAADRIRDEICDIELRLCILADAGDYYGPETDALVLRGSLLNAELDAQQPRYRALRKAMSARHIGPEDVE